MRIRQQDTRPRQTWRRQGLALAMVALGGVGLAACGGGGGDTRTSTAGGASDPPDVPTDAVIDPLVDGPEVYRFAVDASMDSEDALARAAGGSLYAGWNPDADAPMREAGMKVAFFGRAAGCEATRGGGPVAADAGPTRTEALRRAAMAAAANGLTWTPSALTEACDTGVRSRIGPSLVHLNPDASAGGIAMFTASGPRGDNNAEFFGPFDALGQDGAGANAHIVGTFVTMRQDWRAADPLQPWGDSAAQAGGVARVVARQAVGSTRVGSVISADQTVQAKQQVSVSFLNTACMRETSTLDRPCQLVYLFNTAIVRAGVSDWDVVDWFNDGSVWFDPGQGGIPIIEGPVKDAGQTVRDADNQLGLFSSAGEPTQHGTFRNLSFDLRISFSQLGNALRIVNGRRLGVAPESVSEASMRQFWGTRWNDPSAWVLLSVTNGQEVYNPVATRAAWIGGRLREVYVGPQS